MNTAKQIKSIVLTMQAIDAVRVELSIHSKQENEPKCVECLTRLSNLYASINAKEFIECVNDLENKANVVKVDFRKEK
jgi:hypothetical protein